MNPRTKIIAGAVALFALLFSVSWWWEHRAPPLTTEQAIAHERTAQKVEAAAKVESVYVAVRDSAMAGRVVVQHFRDTLLVRLTDTLRVKEYIARTDTLLRRDSTALAAADQTIHSLHVVIAAKDTELVFARVSHPAPRLTMTVAALYDPLAGQPSASGGVALRVIGGLALVARADQRPILERPAVRVGVAYTF